ncbi:MAG TPA: galactose oxidase-like domain-containing protein [Gemmatimonadales bacterium]|nr:galactose oxidase-like domain-containing protein [Gemmatimonadales bacterium]
MRVRTRLSLAAFAVLLAGSVITCTGDNESPDGQTGPDGLLLAGAPSSLKLNVQPPSGALESEVWIPSRQPIVVVKDASGVVVPGVVVTASIASGSGTLQGKLAITTNGSGIAKFLDLGIAGTGPHTLRFSTSGPSITSGTVTLSALPPEATTGDWGAPVSWDIVPLHMSLLPTGKILAWGKYETGTTSMSEPRLWNPAVGAPTTAAIVADSDMLFCSGHTIMADGKVLVSGGHLDDNKGLRATNIFDPVSETWAPNLPKMALGRWYPTVTMLADGRLVTVAGRDANAKVVLVPEIWEGGTWVRLPGASFTFPYYPRQFLAPNGKIFYAGERIQGRWLDVDAVTASGRGKWTSATGLKHLWPYNRDYGSAVMYETGKVMVVGGGGYTGWSTPDPKSATPTPTAETIDLNLAGPAWKSTDPMHHPRRHLNATILPDGQVLVTGGTSGGGFNDLANAVHAAEVWNPTTGHWTELAANSVDRAYHSVSLLLPDATVLHGASGDAGAPDGSAYPARRNHEIFRPPYLFKGARPVINSVSQTTLGYGQVLTVNTSYAQQITQVRWIRLGSVTHAFDADQRANSLSFSKTASAVKVTTPSNAKKAPPGYYMLFILNRNGVPSAGRIVRVQ